MTSGSQETPAPEVHDRHTGEAALANQADDIEIARMMAEINEELDLTGNNRFGAGRDLEFADREARDILLIPKDVAQRNGHIARRDEGIFAPAARRRARMGIFTCDDDVEAPVALHAGDDAYDIATVLEDYALLDMGFNETCKRDTKLALAGRRERFEQFGHAVAHRDALIVLAV